MKNVLLAGTALLGLALISSPAAAELNLDLGGHFRGYGVYSDSDVAGANANDFELRRDTEVHFTGEATSDNGLTVGVHYEAMVGGALETDEAYAYFAGNWGRVNLGSEDGAAYLLQVAAPSADSNVDGLRVAVQANDQTALSNAATMTGINGYTGVFSDAFGTAATTVNGTRLLDYDHADFQDTDRLTYLTPKFSGFQGGLSYAPQAGQKAIGNGVSAVGNGNVTTDQYENLWEAAARWDGEFEGFGLSAGAGYSTAETQNNTGTYGDLDTWNAGLNVAFQGFSVGGAYLNSQVDLTAGGNEDSDTWVVGAAWDNGPYHVGASYLDQNIDNAGTETDADRWTVGAGYTYGPGMSFRGAVANGNVDDGTTDEDFTQVTLGTDIQF